VKARDFSVNGLYRPGYDAVLSNEKLTAKTFRVLAVILPGLNA